MQQHGNKVVYNRIRKAMAQQKIHDGPTPLHGPAHLCRSGRDSAQTSRQRVQQRPAIQPQVTADMSISQGLDAIDRIGICD